MLNKAMLIGNLGADPETRFTQDGTCVCNIRVATTERFKNKSGERQERTEWHRVVLWGRLAEIANEYLRKGSRVYLEGRIETRKWTDRDGNERYTTEIRANEMKMLSGRDGGGYQAEPPSKPAAEEKDPFANAPDFSSPPADDDIPF